MFNEPGEGEDFLIVDAKVFLEKWEHPEDEKFSLWYWDFEYYTQDYNKYRALETFVVEDEFRMEAYEGATAKGKLGFLIPKDDNGYIVLYEKFWWKLSQ